MNTGCKEYQDQLLALLEGDLDDATRARVTAHVESCPECRAELDGLKTVSTDLETMGEEMVKGITPPDLVQAVMASIERGQLPSRVTSSTAAHRVHRILPWRWAGLAAAAILLLGVFVGIRVITSHQTPQPVQTKAGFEPMLPVPEHPETKPVEPVEQTPRGRFDHARGLLRDTPDVRHGVTKPIEAVEPPDLKSLTLQDILSARKESFTSESALSRLSQWASLAPQRARELIESAEATSDAVVGAASSLPPEEREGILMAAVGQFIREPYPQYQLTKATLDSSQPKGDPASQLSKLSETDPENALSHYMAAKALLDEGRVSEALERLRYAQSLPGATAYPGEAALYNEAALVQSGMEPDVAHALVALNAGTNEYGDLFELGQALLEYGRYYESQGDRDTALEIYNSVQRFGEQLADSSDYTQEQLAGLDLQRASIDMLGHIYAEYGSDEELDSLTTDTNELVEGIQVVRDIIYAVNDLFQGNIDETFLRRVSDIILRVGDSNLLDYLNL